MTDLLIIKNKKDNMSKKVTDVVVITLGFAIGLWIIFEVIMVVINSNFKTFK